MLSVLGGYEMISCANLKITTVYYMWAPWETVLERVPSLESFKNEGLFQLHNEKVSNSCCSRMFLVQLSPHAQSQSTHQGPLAEMVCFGTTIILEIHRESKYNKKKQGDGSLLKHL